MNTLIFYFHIIIITLVKWDFNKICKDGSVDRNTQRPLNRLPSHSCSDVPLSSIFFSSLNSIRKKGIFCWNWSDSEKKDEIKFIGIIFIPTLWYYLTDKFHYLCKVWEDLNLTLQKKERTLPFLFLREVFILLSLINFLPYEDISRIVCSLRYWAA